VVENPAVVGSQQPFDASRIVVLSGLDSVRQRPALYVGTPETGAIDKLLWFAIDGVLAHYQSLGWPLESIVVRLEDDSSATVTVGPPTGADAALEEGSRLLERELRVLGVGSPVGLFVANALSSRLEAATPLPRQRRRCLTFEQGVLCHDQDNATGSGFDNITLTFWPDTAIVGSGTFDEGRVRQELRPLADAHPTVAIEVVDARHDVKTVRSL